MTTRQRLVIRDDATWAAVWALGVGTEQPAPPAPAIDFARHAVIVAAMGWASPGDAITIDDVRIVEGHAWIAITEKSPVGECWFPAVVVKQVTAAVVPRFDGQATSVEHTAQYACK